MKKHKVVSAKALPARFPLIHGVVLWLLLDRLQAPGWVQGVSWTLYALIASGLLVAIIQQVPIEVFKQPKDEDV